MPPGDFSGFWSIPVKNFSTKGVVKRTKKKNNDYSNVIIY